MQRPIVLSILRQISLHPSNIRSNHFNFKMFKVSESIIVKLVFFHLRFDSIHNEGVGVWIFSDNYQSTPRIFDSRIGHCPTNHHTKPSPHPWDSSKIWDRPIKREGGDVGCRRVQSYYWRFLLVSLIVLFLVQSRALHSYHHHWLLVTVGTPSMTRTLGMYKIYMTNMMMTSSRSFLTK